MGNVSNGGRGGTTVADWATYAATWLALQPSEGVYAVLINLGVNDMVVGGSLPIEATWIANYETLLDAIHSRWPPAQVYLTRPWMQGHDADSTTLHGRIDTIVSDRSSFVHVLDDEALWLKGSDNGASETTDGTHYSPFGMGLATAAKQAALGY